MASIIMHMAVAMNIIRSADVDTDRFLLGTVLPDYIYEENAHYKAMAGGRKFFDITRFRAEHEAKMKSNPIYLGYYMHLVQDAVFRDFMYNTHRWNPRIPGNVEKLYGDYRRLNGYLIGRFDLNTDILKRPEAIPTEEYPDFSLNIAEMTEETGRDLSVVAEPDYKYFFFTPEMAEAFITKASKMCLDELAALKGKGSHIDERALSRQIP